MDDKEYGDFEEMGEEGSEGNGVVGEQTEFVRARLPRGTEKIGVILQRLGGNRMQVKSGDGKTRNCRVPGKYKRKLWLRERDIVIIVPWVDDDDKGDIIYKYSSSGVNQLRKKGLLGFAQDEF